jgi:glucuronate isomerase
MSQSLRDRIYQALDQRTLIDPHTHIDAHHPASTTLADILGYHYYTELAHSAGMPRERIEHPDLDPREKVARLVEYFGAIDNTVQFHWLLEMAQRLFGFPHDFIDSSNWESLYDLAQRHMSDPHWPQRVLQASGLEAVFLTNEFDDPLEGFDTRQYIPCLRADDLVFHLSQPATRQRLARASGVEPHSPGELKEALGNLFAHFCSRGARACAISLPPDFTPVRVDEPTARQAFQAVWRRGPEAEPDQAAQLARFVFWSLAELCAENHLPFDLMIGVVRGVYRQGVHQGRDLYDSRVSLIQYRELFNAFPKVTFPISVLASVTNQELASYAWIFPNLVTLGHWWYSNTPRFIEQDAAARLEAVPRTKQIGYYSDMYKLEFALPKFAMYKRIMAGILAERFVIDRGWSEERAIGLGHQVLDDNVRSIFSLD